MNKAIVYAGVGIGVAAIAYLGYRYMQNPSQSYMPTSVNPNSNPYFTTSDYQSYPFIANVPPRVDNSNQPWANNNRAAINGVSTPQLDVNVSNVKMIAESVKAGADIIDSGRSIWESVSDWYDSGDSDWTMTDWEF